MDLEYNDQRAYRAVGDPVTDTFFTFFMCDPDMPDEIGEEIDVEARSLKRAREVLKAAVARDYEPIKEHSHELRYKGIMYL